MFLMCSGLVSIKFIVYTVLFTAMSPHNTVSAEIIRKVCE